ncbi:MAG: alpha/beta hydrolase [Acidobacteriota bacterium]
MSLEATAGQTFRTILSLGGVVVAAGLGLKILALVLEPRLTFFPPPGLPVTPAALALPYEDVSVRTGDGVRLHGWFIPAACDRSAAPLTLLFFHGNAENISPYITLARLTRDAGYSLLLIDYRGYGRSEGSPSERGIYADGEAALRYLRGRDDVDPRRIVLWGRSIGSAVAVHLAARAPAGGPSASRPAGVILESSFTSALELLRDGGYWPLYPLALLGSYRFDQAAKIGGVESPLMVIHGTEDRVVPFRLGRRLFDLAPGGKVFVAIRGGGHNDLLALHAGALWEGVRRFLDSLG